MSRGWRAYDPSQLKNITPFMSGAKGPVNILFYYVDEDKPSSFHHTAFIFHRECILFTACNILTYIRNYIDVAEQEYENYSTRRIHCRTCTFKAGIRR
jgi:hypothetical protein